MPDDLTVTVRPLQRDDLDAMIAIRQASFGTPRAPVDAETLSLFAKRLPFMRGVERNGHLVAACTWYPKPSWIGGVKVATTGLAAVVSAPQARRRGYVRRLITDGLREGHEAGVGWASEHPFDPPFYDRMGFRTIASSALLELPCDRVPRGSAPSFEPAGIDDPALREVRTAFAAQRSFLHDRDDPAGFDPNPDGVRAAWSDLLDPPNDRSTPGTPYRCEDGYAVLAVEGHGHEGILHVIDAAWSSPQGRANVLTMLSAWDGQVGRVRLELPVDDPLARRDRDVWSKPRAPLQIRMVDLPSALAPLRAPDGLEGVVTLEVSDALAPWNAGTWRIDANGDGCHVERTLAPADAILDVGALAVLLAGTSPAALLASGEAQGSLRALDLLHALTRDHPPFFGLADYF